jgi:uncharacterized protein with HEPN domain
MLSPLEYLRHILDEAEYLMGQTQGLSQDEFLNDETLKRAFVRSIEIIGEAAKKVPDNLKQKYPQIEWRAIAGMRDREHSVIDYSHTTRHPPGDKLAGLLNNAPFMGLDLPAGFIRRCFIARKFISGRARLAK